MLIGELASEAGVSVRVIRHYEAQGLIHSTRTSNGYRSYPSLAIERVRRIRVLIECGFSTRQIQEFLPCLDETERFDPEACAASLDQHVAKLQELDALIEVLKVRRLKVTERLARFGVSSFSDHAEKRKHHAAAIPAAPVSHHAARRRR